MLRKSQRSKLIVAGLIVAGAAGAILWTSGGPIGKKDDASSVFVVRSGPARYGPALRGLGFDVVEGELDYFLAQAGEHTPKFEGTDVETVLHLADWSGHAYVAFEDPAALDFSGIELADKNGDIVQQDDDGDDAAVATMTDSRFAVVSVGNYGFPHRLTTTPQRSRAHAGKELDLLTTLFEQYPLTEAADEAAKAPHEIFALRTRLQGALERLDEIAAADETISRIHNTTRKTLTEDERGEPRPAVLGSLDESVSPAIALADGSILTIVRRVDISSRNGLSADIDLGRTWRFFYNPANTTSVEERKVCTSLRGGEMQENGQRPRFRWSVAGDALLIDDGTTPQLHRLVLGGEPCSFELVGPVELPAGDRRNLGIPHGSGAVARTFRDGGDTVVAVTTPGESDASRHLELARASELAEFGSPVWLDSRHLAAVGAARFVGDDGGRPAQEDEPGAEDGAQEEPDDAVAGIFLFSLDHPGEAILIPAGVFEDAGSAWHVAAVGPSGDNKDLTADATPQLVVAAPGAVRHARLYRLDLPSSYVELFTTALAGAGDDREAANAAAAREAGDPGLEIELRAPGFTQRAIAGPRVHLYWPGLTATTRLHDNTGVTDPVVSPDGQTVVFQIDTGRDGYEIGTVSLGGGGELTVLTDNDLDDHTPMFTADSASVVFRTRYKIQRTTWKLTAGRVLPAPR